MILSSVKPNRRCMSSSPAQDLMMIGNSLMIIIQSKDQYTITPQIFFAQKFD